MRALLRNYVLLSAALGCTAPVTTEDVEKVALPFSATTWPELGAELRARTPEFQSERELRLGVVENEIGRLRLSIDPNARPTLSELVIVDPYEQCALTGGNPTLYPALPFSNDKHYHYAASEAYDERQMRLCDRRCAKSRGEEDAFCNASAVARADELGRHPMCASNRVHALAQVILSDLFMDACGNYYRAFWQVVFESQDENFGTLLSKGRRIYDRGCADGVIDPYYDGTYDVEMSAFLFFAAATDVERQKISQQLAEALTPVDIASLRPGLVPTSRGFTFDPETHLFTIDPRLVPILTDPRYCFYQ